MREKTRDVSGSFGRQGVWWPFALAVLFASTDSEVVFRKSPRHPIEMLFFLRVSGQEEEGIFFVAHTAVLPAEPSKESMFSGGDYTGVGMR